MGRLPRDGYAGHRYADDRRPECMHVGSERRPAFSRRHLVRTGIAIKLFMLTDRADHGAGGGRCWVLRIRPGPQVSYRAG